MDTLQYKSKIKESKIKEEYIALENGKNSTLEGQLSDQEISRQFSDFWANYPSDGRHDRPGTEKVFRRILEGGGRKALKAIVRATNGYIDFLKYEKDERKFNRRALYAKTFLNGRYKEFVEFEWKGPL